MLTKEELETLRDLEQELYQGLNADCETGSHSLNNFAADKFKRQYPSLCQAMHNLSVWVDKQEDLGEPNETSPS